MLHSLTFETEKKSNKKKSKKNHLFKKKSYINEVCTSFAMADITVMVDWALKNKLSIYLSSFAIAVQTVDNFEREGRKGYETGE